MTTKRSDDIETVYGGCDEGLVALYCRGHGVPSGVFVRAAEHYLGPPSPHGLHPDAERPLKNESVQREWWRVVPCRGTGVFDALFKLAKPRARGAFPVTVIHLEEWDR